jgi:L-seryl-tRNA(Ser) seleniumtransferase
MAADKNASLLRGLPRVDQILSDPGLAPYRKEHGRDAVLEAARQVVAELREKIKRSIAPAEAVRREEVVQSVARRLQAAKPYRMGRAVNATGIVLHTGLGRAVLPPAAVDAVSQELRGYTMLEIDRATGERSIREEPVAALLCKITGAEAATAVNNNAAGTLLSLAALGSGREALVSRSQLVEIGGSFRIPDVMAQSGCRLVEVGTTNKTRLSDYERAVTPDTGLLLHVHTSNYRIVGFTEQVEIEPLVAFGRERGLPVMDDLGSGSLVDLSPWGILDEPTVQRSVRAGADVIAFSGDKLLGGPQAGLILGHKKMIAQIRRHPLFRAFRPGKFTLLALEATLRLYLNPETLFRSVPTLAQLTASRKDLEPRARSLAERLRSIPGLEVEILDDASEAGGGSMPAHPLPTRVVAIRSKTLSLEALARKLRDHQPPIFSRVQKERVLLDVRTLMPGDEEAIAAALGPQSR